ncbi:MAG: hypothetical protein HZC41_26945 [Chloroflexi bacterium]|nr:hypothetical protein [Chloroflexota bacterium]
MVSHLPSVRGLTTAEVAERVRRGETNAYKARVGRTYWQIVRDNVLNLFNVVLFTLLSALLVIITGFQTAIAQESDSAFISDLDWSPDGTLLAVAVSTARDEPDCNYTLTDSYAVRLIDTASGAVTATIDSDSSCSIVAVDFNPAGTQLFTVAFGGVYEKWDIASKQRLQAVRIYSLFLGGSWNPDGTEVMIFHTPGVLIYDQNLIDPPLTPIPLDLRSNDLTYAIWSPDGSKIATSYANGSVDVWNVTTGQGLVTFQGHTSSVLRFAWNPVLNVIASGDANGTIWVWDASSGQAISQLAGLTGAIRDLAWRPDGQQLASAGADNTVRAWDWPSGQMQIVNGNQSAWAVTYSPDGSKLAYGGEDDSIAIVPAPTTSTPIAFTSARDGNLELYRLTGTATTRLTNNAVGDAFVDW